MTPDLSNPNSLAASLIVEELVRCRVTTFCISPGSRSAPLTAAAARHPDISTVTHFDERAAAFFALSHVRATGKPAALICTSGTATANYLPAVVEASQEMLPLILLTADRPPELRNRGANQTIHQPRLYGDYVRYSVDLSCPQNDIPPSYWLDAVDQAMEQALASPAGPIHLNCPFREPLAPIADGIDRTGDLDSVNAWLRSNDPYLDIKTPAIESPSRDIDRIIEIAQQAETGLIVVGHLRNVVERTAVQQFSQALGWPVLADIRSQLRLVSDQTPVLRYYDLLLRAECFPEQLRSTTIIQFGTRLTSKLLLEFLDHPKPNDYVLIDSDPRRHDPINRVTLRIVSDISLFSKQFLSRWKVQPSVGHTEVVSEMNRAVDDVIDSILPTQKEISEAAVARLLVENTPDGSNLFIASSMPIRLMDMYADAAANITIASNRGASGIDGTLASAAGFAHGSGKPTTALIGDLAMLHDLNSLALLSTVDQPVIIVVLNNRGGGIFDHLPIAEFGDIFEEFFITPHDLTFKHAAAMFELPYEEVDSADGFVHAYREAVNTEKAGLIEISIDRRASMATHEAIMSEIRQRLD
jgi:2-succinyl-5-enolpyruvyl-6-hydroxy-3-cyclohexene-1-carboxylate synthase